MTAERIIAAGIACARTDLGRYRVEDIQLYSGYAEPGYSDPDSGLVALSDWNSVTRWDEDAHKFVEVDEAPGRVAALLERLGAKLEWSDEWLSCDSCGLLFRCKPDSYSWQQSGVFEDGCCCCADCLDGADHLANLEGQSDRCNTVASISPDEHGYVLLSDDFEHGFHPGQDADPGLIAKLLESVGCTRYVFNLDGTGQFDVAFSVWLHESESHLLAAAKRVLATGKTDGPSVSDGLQRSLGDASSKLAELPDGQGVKYADCKPDGTADVRIVSPQEFIDGIGVN
jgi:hypothetical protein